MAEHDPDPDDGHGAGDGGRKKLSGKKLILFVVLPVVLLLLAAAGVFFSGILGGGEETAEAAADEHGGGGHEKPAADAHGAAPKEDAHGGGHGGSDGGGLMDPEGVYFFDVPDMLVNLNADGRRPTYLKISISLEVSRQSEIEKIKGVMPRILDNFQVYLRELRLEELRGSAGMHRLREELLVRVSTAAHPIRIKDVLFREMLIQ